MKYKYICGRLGKEILRIRKERVLSQDDLVVNCNMDRSYLAEVEEGKANPSLKVLFKWKISQSSTFRFKSHKFRLVKFIGWTISTFSIFLPISCINIFSPPKQSHVK